MCSDTSESCVTPYPPNAVCSVRGAALFWDAPRPQVAKSRRNWPGGYGKQADYSKRLNAGERCGRVATAARAASHHIHQTRCVTFVVRRYFETHLGRKWPNRSPVDTGGQISHAYRELIHRHSPGLNEHLYLVSPPSNISQKNPPTHTQHTPLCLSFPHLLSLSPPLSARFIITTPLLPVLVSTVVS